MSIRVIITCQGIKALEQVSKKFTRKKREYTDEQRAAIRIRLLAGQEASRNKWEAEVKVDKPQTSKVDKSKKVIRIDKKKVDRENIFELS